MCTCELPTDFRILTPLHLSVLIFYPRVRCEFTVNFTVSFTENMTHAQTMCVPGPFSSSSQGLAWRGVAWPGDRDEAEEVGTGSKITCSSALPTRVLLDRLEFNFIAWRGVRGEARQRWRLVRK